MTLEQKQQIADLERRLQERDAEIERLLKDGEHGMTRWEVGFRNIVTILLGPHLEFEIPEVVSLVRDVLRRLERQRERAEAAEGRVAEITDYSERADAAIDECGQRIRELTEEGLRRGYLADQAEARVAELQGQLAEARKALAYLLDVAGETVVECETPGCGCDNAGAFAVARAVIDAARSQGGRS